LNTFLGVFINSPISPIPAVANVIPTFSTRAAPIVPSVKPTLDPLSSQKSPLKG